ncbi:MAG: 6-bladed beta-propeller [Gemmatimonadaceae bacterium]|nr:6-bladed beta-propeller [Gemmatimonadaceae bacterium]MCW5827481.1 6-bladed beta-propeller [Gemmatimonadaceae bacterium]
MMLRTLLLATAVMLAACTSDAPAPDAGAGLVTVFDSSRADTIIARTAGSVAPARVQGVREEMRIAPAMDDTTLFAEVSESDVGPSGELYVFDQPNQVLLIFDSTGALQRRVGRRGAGPGEFYSNNGMVVLRDGRLAQWGARNGRVSFFSPDGDFLTSWAVPTGFSTSNGIRTDSSGTLYAYRPVTAPRDGGLNRPGIPGDSVS